MEKILPDDFTERITDRSNTEPQGFVEVGLSRILGTRKEQQDSLSCKINESNRELFAVVCDGMGGLSEGEKAAATAVKCFYDCLLHHPSVEMLSQYLYQTAQLCDKKVHQLMNSNGGEKTGTTMVGIFITGNKLFWVCVGDSRIYLLRKGRIKCITREHNFSLLLSQRVQRGEMSPEEAVQVKGRRDALISYIGMGSASLIDVNESPILLHHEDKILLCSDGLFKSLSDDEIVKIIAEYSLNTEFSANALSAAALKCAKNHQDNTTVILINYL